MFKDKDKKRNLQMEKHKGLIYKVGLSLGLKKENLNMEETNTKEEFYFLLFAKPDIKLIEI